MSASRFTVIDTPLEGLKIIQRQQLGDARGFLARMFCSEELHAAGWHGAVAQINHTGTGALGTVRGMHYQNAPHAEKKLVSCVRGKVWDVALDLRPSSRTYLQWFAQELSADNKTALLIPEGFAHGFQTLAPDCELIYLHSVAYNANAEAGVNPLDAQINITWPLEISIMSERDKNHPLIAHQ